MLFLFLNIVIHEYHVEVPSFPKWIWNNGLMLRWIRWMAWVVIMKNFRMIYFSEKSDAACRVGSFVYTLLYCCAIWNQTEKMRNIFLLVVINSAFFYLWKRKITYRLKKINLIISAAYELAIRAFLSPLNRPYNLNNVIN